MRYIVYHIVSYTSKHKLKIYFNKVYNIQLFQNKRYFDFLTLN